MSTLAGAALRLAAVEVLRPHRIVATDDRSGAAIYPTLARHLIYDSRGAGLADIDRDRSYTPVGCLFTAETGHRLRGEMTDIDDVEADASLDLICELCIAAIDDGEEFVGVMAEDDPQARLVLEAFVSQCLYALERSQAGGLFRKIRARLIRMESVASAVPQYGLRFQRITTRLHYQIMPDRYSDVPGELPEPMLSLHAALPDGSYAKGKLSELAALFNPDPLSPLEAVEVTSGPVKHGLA